MKSTRILVSILCLLLSFSGWAQSQNVVVLVDVSGSIPHLARDKARDMIRELLTGSSISAPFYYEKDPASSLTIPGTPLAGKGAHILLMRFGEKTTQMASDLLLSNYPQDLDDFLNAHYPTSIDYRDQYTFLTLAKARAAQVAKLKGMDTYTFLLISDDINDDNIGGHSPNYSKEEKDLVDHYNSKSNPIVEGSIEGYVRLQGNEDFKVPVRAINLSKYIPPPPIRNQPPNQPPPVLSAPSIEFTGSLASATSQRPTVFQSNNVIISWLCKSCADNTLYDVVIQGAKGTKFHDANSRNLSTTSIGKNLEAGNYKVAVTAENPTTGQSISGAVTYVTVDTNSGLGWLWLLLPLAVIGGAYYWHRETQKKRLREAGRQPGSILDETPRQASSKRDDF